MVDMITKPTVIITSGGRTGTMFFVELFSEVLDDAIAIHEPERITLSNPREAAERISKFGFLNTVIRKLLGSWGITSISNRRMGGGN